ncbi:hypothetical protein EYE40_14390 [Glaciihabitans arcticus]|uniref:Uncharacterized protein n=1 Tax=Glaciihabitans arcticus TaxID=2668039 RepID=A0A4V2JEI4_9MICO|nr:hypothetical protein [Glaciihabitans arcticus]TBN55396.1 hypothetical protein EYE40_14390 [Glaciihabitans arcticus]
MTAPRSFIVTLVLPLALLAGCAPEPPPIPLPLPVEGEPTPTAEADPLPDDAMLLVTAVATATNGAQLDLRAVVREPQGWNLPAAKPGLDRLLEWCDGELDQASIEAGNFTVVPVEYSATAVGDTAWPNGETIWLHPEPGRAVLAATGAIKQVEVVDESQPGDYVPHCLQNATMPGAGEGTVYLGFEGDTGGNEDYAIGHAWASVSHGFSNTQVEAAANIDFSECTAKILPAGTEWGAPGLGWAEDFVDYRCTVGGPL